ncbi:MAG: Asp23/Gls24 family envelope stress response protein [Eubacteriales bacterium]|nr:Asp23/Gls24 family envelope stress response protein [Eubacteriales bacterium]
MGKEERNTYTIQRDENVGEVKIADEVVASIAAFATMDVEGVASIGGTTKEMGRLSMKTPSKGVKIDVLEGIVTVTLTLNLLYGYSLVEVSNRIQEKVKTSIESMTGLTVADVNIRVVGVKVPEEA